MTLQAGLSLPVAGAPLSQFLHRLLLCLAGLKSSLRTSVMLIRGAYPESLTEVTFSTQVKLKISNHGEQRLQSVFSSNLRLIQASISRSLDSWSCARMIWG